jgi:hypothetical protein
MRADSRVYTAFIQVRVTVVLLYCTANYKTIDPLDCPFRDSDFSDIDYSFNDIECASVMRD